MSGFGGALGSFRQGKSSLPCQSLTGEAVARRRVLGCALVSVHVKGAALVSHSLGLGTGWLTLGEAVPPRLTRSLDIKIQNTEKKKVRLMPVRGTQCAADSSDLVVSAP